MFIIVFPVPLPCGSCCSNKRGGAGAVLRHNSVPKKIMPLFAVSAPTNYEISCGSLTLAVANPLDDVVFERATDYRYRYVVVT
jgi:hypothetical protein